MYNIMMLLFMIGIFVFVVHIYKLLNLFWDILKANNFLDRWYHYQDSNKKDR